MSYLLPFLLALIGVAIAVLGLNAGLGGIRTLGWQVDPAFIQITDAATFATQDSHARFLGAIWFGVGLVFLAGSLWRARLQDSLIVLCLVIALAGLFRLFGPLPMDVWGSLGFELIGFPVLAYWLHRARL